MGYRTLNIPKKPEDSLRRFAVRNGAIMRVAFGCFYLSEGHDPHFHDYTNWPAPNYHPGGICQMRPVRDVPRFMASIADCEPVNLEQIHLTEEGYTDVAISIDDDDIAQYLTTEVSIDNVDDYIIRLKVRANLPLFEDKPKETRFTVFVKKSDDSAVDAVCHGIITILPGSPYPEE